jgi:hypothetical protein
MWNCSGQVLLLGLWLYLRPCLALRAMMSTRLRPRDCPCDRRRNGSPSAGPCCLYPYESQTATRPAWCRSHCTSSRRPRRLCSVGVLTPVGREGAYSSRCLDVRRRVGSGLSRARTKTFRCGVQELKARDADSDIRRAGCLWARASQAAWHGTGGR